MEREPDGHSTVITAALTVPSDPASVYCLARIILTDK